MRTRLLSTWGNTTEELTNWTNNNIGKLVGQANGEVPINYYIESILSFQVVATKESEEGYDIFVLYSIREEVL